MNAFPVDAAACLVQDGQVCSAGANERLGLRRKHFAVGADGDTRLLVPPNALSRLASAIGRLADNCALRHTLGTAARTKYGTQCAPSCIGQQVRALYASCPPRHAHTNSTPAAASLA